MNVIYTHWVDFAIIAIIAISTVIGLIRGFVREVLSLISWLLAIWVSLNFSPLFADFLTAWIATPGIRIVLAFSALFVCSVAIGGLISHIIVKFVRQSGLSGTDRSLGLVFGGVRGTVLIAVLVLIIYMGDVAEQPALHGSFLIPYFKPIAVWLKDLIPATFTV